MLARRPGVVGVFLGNGTHAGVWGPTSCVVVHVVRKVHLLHLSRTQRLPENVGPYPVDVIEVSAARTHALDISDEVAAPGTLLRTGTLTAVFAAQSGGVALLSGHVTLPCRDGQIVAEYDSRDDTPVALSAVDRANDQLYRGVLLRGKISPRADWSVVLFPKAQGAALDSVHPLTGSSPPLRLRSEPLSAGEPLRHHSRISGEVRHGRLWHEALSGVKMKLADGSQRVYAALLAVAPNDNHPFSKSGDSGSLVCDSDGLAVGTILGGADNGSLSYVLPLNNLRNPLGDRFEAFFQE